MRRIRWFNREQLPSSGILLGAHPTTPAELPVQSLGRGMATPSRELLSRREVNVNKNFTRSVMI